MVLPERKIAPGVWFTLALTSLAFTLSKSALSEWFEPITIAVMFWILLSLAAVFLFLAIREYYIREGLAIAHQHALPTATLAPIQTRVEPVAPPVTPSPVAVAPPPAPQPNLQVVKCGNVSAYQKSGGDGRFYAKLGAYDHGTMSSASVAVIANSPVTGRTIGVARSVGVTLRFEGGGHAITIARGAWMNSGDEVGFAVGDAHELIIACKYQGHIHTPEWRGSMFSLISLPLGTLKVTVQLFNGSGFGKEFKFELAVSSAAAELTSSHSS